jgi:hypothetical protein
LKAASLLLLSLLGGCALGADAGLLQQPVFSPKGASMTGRLGVGGGGMRDGNYLLGIDLDTRVDIASDGSRWAAGASVLGGVNVGGIGVYEFGRVGVWRAIVSGAPEASAVPTLELGAFVPVRERFDPKRPEHGASADGVIFGVREDIDEVSYTTVFVGYALFLSPGY